MLCVRLGSRGMLLALGVALAAVLCAGVFGVSEARDPTIRQSPLDAIVLCAADEYATITYQGVVCRSPSGGSWVNECNTLADCCSSGEFLKITPSGTACVSFADKSSTYTTFCADCCGIEEFAVITTLGLRCAGAGCTKDSECTNPLSYCDPTVDRCVRCMQDSHCAGSENYCVSQQVCAMYLGYRLPM